MPTKKRRTDSSHPSLPPPYRTLLKRLRAEFPPRYPVEVRRVKMVDHGTSTRDGRKFKIRINREIELENIWDTLLHEWAHLLGWDPRERLLDAHDRKWGETYAELYSVYIDGKELPSKEDSYYVKFQSKLLRGWGVTPFYDDRLTPDDMVTTMDKIGDKGYDISLQRAAGIGWVVTVGLPDADPADAQLKLGGDDPLLLVAMMAEKLFSDD